MWLFDSNEMISEHEILEIHLDYFNEIFLKHIVLLKELQRKDSLTIYCYYRTNLDSSGIDIPHKSLELYSELKIPFGITFGYIG